MTKELQTIRECLLDGQARIPSTLTKELREYLFGEYKKALAALDTLAAEPSGKCPICGAPEVDAKTPRTVYACGASDYDQRPGTLIQCKEAAEPSEQLGTESNPFVGTFNSLCFKRHDSELLLSVCERDQGFELTVIPRRTGPKRHYAIDVDGSIKELAAEPSEDSRELVKKIRATKPYELTTSDFDEYSLTFNQAAALVEAALQKVREECVKKIRATVEGKNSEQYSSTRNYIQGVCDAVDEACAAITGKE
jgi:hypothetical protein